MAGRGFVEDLKPEIRANCSDLGALMVERLVATIGGADKIEAYGKAAVVGADGEIEHASAVIHTLRFGNHCIPAGVVNVVTGYGPSTGAALTRHPLVRKIAFTGGAATARHVVRSSAENFAKLSLELGGKSPNIIFADADLDSAINGAIAGIYAASGQSCVSGSRLLVQDEIYDEFV